MDLDELEAERRAKVLWIIKGGGRWGLELSEIAWSTRLDERGKELFPAKLALELARASCEALLALDEVERREDFFRLVLWRREPW